MRTIFTRFCCSLLLLSAPAPAAAQAAAFAVPVSSGAGTSVSNAVLADMNLDGRLDVVTTNQSDNVVSVLLGLGNGRFAAPLDAPAGAPEGPLAVGDVDRDGKPDVVLASDGGISVMFGTGTGRFRSLGVITSSPSRNMVRLADFDRDGYLDVMTGRHVKFGNGNTFPGTAIAIDTASTQPTDAAIADLNSDGYPDLIIANQFTSTVSVNLNTTNRSFYARFDYGTGMTPGTVSVGDVNSDGRLDVAIGDLLTLRVFPGSGTGTLLPPFVINQQPLAVGTPRHVVLADANGDGRLDIVNNSGVLLGNGVGDFGPARNVTHGLRPFAVADLNHDARPDLVDARVSSEGGFVEVALNTTPFTPAGSFASPLATPTLFNVDWLALAPMSRDANLDVIAARSGNPITGAPGTVIIHLGTGSGTFAPSAGSEQLNRALVNVDFNRDSKPDVVAEFTSGHIAPWLGDGNGGLVAGYGLNPGAPYDAFAVGDFNRDGRNDVAAVRFESSVLSVWLQASSGTSFAQRRDTFSSDRPYDLRVGDVNADGRLDVVALVNEGGALTFLGDGEGNFANGIPSPIAESGSGFALGDMNNDGTLDIVCTDTYSYGFGPHIRVSLGNGDGTFEEAFAVRATNPSSPVLADFNRDGKLDVAIQDAGVAVYFGRGDGTLDARSTHLAGAGKFEAGDINDDGRTDIVALAGDTFSVFLNTASPVGDVSLSVTDSPDPVAAGGRITYEMRVTNNGATAVSGVTVRPGFALGTNVFRPDDTCANGLPYVCHIGTLAAGATTTLTFVVTAGSAGTVSITANVTANAADANTANNSVTVSTTIGGGATVALDRTALRFAATSNGVAFTSQTPAETVRLSVAGTGAVRWTATSDQPWLTVSPASGTGPAVLTVSVAFDNGLPIGGEIMGSVALAFSGASNTAGPIAVTLRTIAGASTAPFGSVDTPLDNTTGVTGAVPFTGWALDDVGVQAVSLCRDAVAGETAVVDPRCGQAAKIYLGDGVFIEGARPDVEAAYPAVPRSGVAGWGFMVLTNMLPNQGNGAFDFFVYARDLEGHATLIGTRRLTVSNATATRPFGTIDTPAQGETVSGSQYVNFGWALTQMPKSIPTNGSTISVLIDGAVVGSVSYNHFRPDIAGLFPGLANSDGAIGFRTIDTTALTNGLHSISWIATDSEGRSEGLGSRYFRVLNNAGAIMAAAANVPALDAATVSALPVDTEPIVMRRGWRRDAAWAQLGANRAGRARVRGEEVDRFELRLGARAGEIYIGFMRAGESLQPLPPGSRLNERTGDFIWAPGAGFVGPYTLVFVRAASGRAIARREVQIILSPKGSGHVGAKVVIDTPRLQQVVAQPFLLAGWAADLDSVAGTGIDSVHVWAYPLAGGAPTFLGTAAYGDNRPDIAAVFGDPFGPSGFGTMVQGLAPGNYDLAVFAWSTVRGDFTPAGTVRVTVR